MGTGDQKTCEALVEEQFDVIKCKEAYEQHRTCFNASMIAGPPLNLKFYAFSTYWYLVEGEAIGISHKRHISYVSDDFLVFSPRAFYNSVFGHLF